MSVSAVLDEGGLEAGLDPGDFGLINIGLFLFSDPTFDVQVVEFLSVYKSYSQLFAMSCVD